MSKELRDSRLGNPEGRAYFTTAHLEADLGARTIRGGAVTIATQALDFTLRTAATVALARLLTPHDFGLVSMVAAALAALVVFKDMGLSQATVQRERISQKQVSTLFWINAVVGVAITSVAVIVAPAIAWFYQEPGLRDVTSVLALGFLTSGVTVQHVALLQRQMRFVALGGIQIFSVVVGLVTGILLAWSGARYWALVALYLSQSVSYALGVWVVSGWRPSLPVCVRDVRSMLTFGGNITGHSVLNYFARNLDRLLIGKFWGAQPLGLYSKAYQLLLLPVSQISTPMAAVAVPALSRLTDSPDRYRAAYLRMIEKLAIVTMPGTALLIGTADWVIELLLGPQWVEAHTIFLLLAGSAFVQPIASSTGWLFVTQNRTHHMLQWGVMGSSILALGIVAGLPWGAAGVAASYSAAFTCVAFPLLLWFVGRTGPVRMADFYRTLLPAAYAAVAVLGILLALRWWRELTLSFMNLALCVVCTALTTLAALGVQPRGRRALQDLRRSLLAIAHWSK